MDRHPCTQLGGHIHLVLMVPVTSGNLTSQAMVEPAFLDLAHLGGEVAGAALDRCRFPLARADHLSWHGRAAIAPEFAGARRPPHVCRFHCHPQRRGGTSC